MNSRFSSRVNNLVPSAPIDADQTVADAVNEGTSGGTYVGLTVSATDAGSVIPTYAFTGSGNPGGLFALDAITGEVTVAPGALFDFETGPSHVITVVASDGLGNSPPANFTITVVNVSAAPVDADPDANRVSEEAANSDPVGVTALASDPSGSATLTYAFAPSGDAGGRFAIDTSTGVISVANVSMLDYETGSSHTVSVIANDGTSDSAPTGFTIEIINAAPSLPVDNDTAASNLVLEGAAIGTYAGVTAGSTDPNGGTVQYRLADSAGGRFAIDPNLGTVTVADGILLNFAEPLVNYTITVEASDGDLVTTADFTIEVANAPPTAEHDVWTISPEDALAGENVLADNGAGEDRDPNGATLNVVAVNGAAGSVGNGVAGDNGGTFTIAASGEFSFNPGSDFDDLAAGEARDTSVSYTLSDGTDTDTTTVTVTVIAGGAIAVELSLSANAGSEAGETVIDVIANADSAVSGNQTVDVDVSGSGITSADFVLSGMQITIPDGDTSGQVSFAVKNDPVVEAVIEQATISISNASSGIVLGSTTSDTVDITDNDSATISIDDVALAEGQIGSTTFTFTVTLDAQVDTDVTFDYETGRRPGGIC